jgi:hypothetical protein
VSIKEKVRRTLLIAAIGLALLTGAPMRPEEIEELMHRMNQPKLAHTLPDESEEGDDPNKRNPRSGRRGNPHRGIRKRRKSVEDSA